MNTAGPKGNDIHSTFDPKTVLKAFECQRGFLVDRGHVKLFHLDAISKEAVSTRKARKAQG